MAYFPKEQSNPITNMVAELNYLLNGQYFTVKMENRSGKTLYSLNLTQFGLKQKKYLYMATLEVMPFEYKQMYGYMQGILVGIRVNLEKK